MVLKDLQVSQDDARAGGSHGSRYQSSQGLWANNESLGSRGVGEPRGVYIELWRQMLHF